MISFTELSTVCISKHLQNRPNMLRMVKLNLLGKQHNLFWPDSSDKPTLKMDRRNDDLSTEPWKGCRCSISIKPGVHVISFCSTEAAASLHPSISLSFTAALTTWSDSCLSISAWTIAVVSSLVLQSIVHLLYPYSEPDYYSSMPNC